MTENKDARALFIEAMSEFVKKDFDRSINLFTQSLAADSNNPLAYTSRGAAYLQREMHGEALADFDRAIAADATYSKAYHLRGLAKERLGDDAAAEKDFGRAIELDQNYGAAYYSRANLYTRRGDNDLAQADIEMVTHLTNRNIEAFANDNNIWRSHHLKVEDAMESEMHR